jgi:hypothetical protein
MSVLSRFPHKIKWVPYVIWKKEQTGPVDTNFKQKDKEEGLGCEAQPTNHFLTPGYIFC